MIPQYCLPVHHKFYKHEHRLADVSSHFQYEGELLFESQDRLQSINISFNKKDEIFYWLG